MRFVSYDPNPYINEDCILYSLPEEFLADDDTQEPEDEPEIREITNNERLELYVQEWERKKIALDDYADWQAIGLSLSHEGEAGLAAFQRVSRFSKKYKPFETEMKFRSFESGKRICIRTSRLITLLRVCCSWPASRVDSRPRNAL